MKKILVIDDEVAIGQLLFNFLSRNGFEVETATSGLGVTAKNVASWMETLMDWVKKVEKSLVEKVEEVLDKKDKR